MQVKTISKLKAETSAKKFRVLGHPVRLQILTAVRSGDKNVNEIVKSVSSVMKEKQRQSGISQHLNALKLNGFIKSKRNGVELFYTPTKEGLSQLQSVFAILSIN